MDSPSATTDLDVETDTGSSYSCVDSASQPTTDDCTPSISDLALEAVLPPPTLKSKTSDTTVTRPRSRSRRRKRHGKPKRTPPAALERGSSLAYLRQAKGKMKAGEVEEVVPPTVLSCDMDVDVEEPATETEAGVPKNEEGEEDEDSGSGSGTEEFVDALESLDGETDSFHEAEPHGEPIADSFRSFL